MKTFNNIPTPALHQATNFASEYDLKYSGINYPNRVYWNLPIEALYEEAIFRGEVNITKGGAIVVHTGKWTARAAQDKYIVKEPQNDQFINWGDYNRPLNNENFSYILFRIQAYLQNRDIFVQDLYVGADERYRLPIRIITTQAWQSIFTKNMFISPKEEEYKKFVPDFTLIVASDFKLDPRIDGTNTETGIIIDFGRRIGVIANTFYAGEIKKTVFTLMNYLLPFENVLPMHCSANVGKNGDVALFFGLSGTGKTSLSADPNRFLIGDDEHGWSDKGVFNFENGCYAKVIRLSPIAEPQIYACTYRFGSILENVVWDKTSREINLDDDSITENTRISYPLEFIPNAILEKKVDNHPKNIIFLTADAYGVLPPIAKLSSYQAMYHFISGYTSKIAGTELGLGKEPQATFSACFGAPFMVHHPFKYAQILKNKIEENKVNVWLLNTGWIGGKYGVGKRIPIQYTRQMLSAALNGDLESVEYRQDPIFGFQIPTSCPQLPNELFYPEKSWHNTKEYWDNYKNLAYKFIENFKKFEKDCDSYILQGAPKP